MLYVGVVFDIITKYHTQAVFHFFLSFSISTSHYRHFLAIYKINWNYFFCIQMLFNMFACIVAYRTYIEWTKRCAADNFKEIVSRTDKSLKSKTIFQPKKIYIHKENKRLVFGAIYTKHNKKKVLEEMHDYRLCCFCFLELYEFLYIIIKRPAQLVSL